MLFVLFNLVAMRRRKEMKELFNGIKELRKDMIYLKGPLWTNTFGVIAYCLWILCVAIFSVVGIVIFSVVKITKIDKIQNAGMIASYAFGVYSKLWGAVFWLLGASFGQLEKAAERKEAERA